MGHSLSKRVIVLGGVFLAELVVMANVRARDPAARVWFHRPHLGISDSSWNEREDLKVGQPAPAVTLLQVTAAGSSPVKLFERPARGDSLSGGKPILLVFIGSCSGCGSNLEGWDKAAKEHPELSTIVVAWASEAEIREAKQSRGLTVPVMSDPGARAGEALKVQRAPRAYLFSANGVVLWIQRKPGMVPSALATLAAGASHSKGGGPS